MKDNKNLNIINIFPVAIYDKIEYQKSLLLKDNQNKTGIYR